MITHQGNSATASSVVGTAAIITATHDTKMLDVSDRIFHMADGKVDRTEARNEIDLQVGKLDGEEVG